MLNPQKNTGNNSLGESCGKALKGLHLTEREPEERKKEEP